MDIGRYGPTGKLVAFRVVMEQNPAIEVVYTQILLILVKGVPVRQQTCWIVTLWIVPYLLMVDGQLGAIGQDVVLSVDPGVWIGKEIVLTLRHSMEA